MTKRTIDLDGLLWTVREVDARRQPGARADTCLICEGTRVVRRSWSYPAEWIALNDTQLLALFDIAAP